MFSYVGKPGAKWNTGQSGTAPVQLHQLSNPKETVILYSHAEDLFLIRKPCTEIRYLSVYEEKLIFGPSKTIFSKNKSSGKAL